MCIRRLTSRFARLSLIVLIGMNLPFGTSVAAERQLTRAIEHGAIPYGELPQQYAILGDSVYYTTNDGSAYRYRIDTGELLEIASPEVDVVRFSAFRKFDGRLLVSLVRNTDGTALDYLYEFNPDTTEFTFREQVKIDLASATEYQGALYFRLLTLTATDPNFLPYCDLTPIYYYQNVGVLESLNDSVRKTDYGIAVCGYMSLKGSDAGLLVTRQREFFGTAPTMQVISSPLEPVGTPGALGLEEILRPFEPSADSLDGTLYFPAIVGSIISPSTTVPDVGPFQLDGSPGGYWISGLGSYSLFNEQVELGTAVATNQYQFYEVNQASTDFVFYRKSLSSFPKDITRIGEALYFSANDTETTRNIFRVESANEPPRVISASSTPGVTRRIVGQVGDTPIVAETAGDNPGLHYVSGGALVPLTEDDTVIQFAESLTSAGDVAVFLSRDASGSRVTYILRSQSIQLLLNGAGDTSAYVVIDNQTRQWIGAACRQELIDAGLTATVSNWGEISGYAPSMDWQPCSDLVALVDTGSNPPGGESDDSIQLLLNGAGDPSAYVVINNATRQWIDGACRQQLVDAGLASTVSNWAEISGYTQTTDWQLCPDLVALVDSDSNPPDDSIQLLLNGAGDTSGYVVINDQTRQWIDGACRDQLINTGLTSTVSNWGEISGYPETMDWQTCAELVAIQ